MFTLPDGVRQLPHHHIYFPHTDSSLPQRVTIGWQCATQPSYSWRGLQRPDGPICIFQYTLAGRGVLERGGVRSVLEAGQAFLVEVPDDHHYYLPAGWEPWEFVFVCFDGGDIRRHARWLIEHHGSVFHLDTGHEALTALSDLFAADVHGSIHDPETLAILLYRLVLGLRRTVDHPVITTKPPITRALQFAAQHFAEDIGVQDLAQAAGLSRAHFSRQFQCEMQQSPMQYLTGVRLERASSLLRGTALPLEDIAAQCGFAGASYFGKIFRKHFAITPSAYRNGQTPLAHE